MSGFSYIHVTCPHRKPVAALASRAQAQLAKWNARQNGPLRGTLQAIDDGVLIELVEGQQSYWYSITKDPSREKVSPVVALLHSLRCLEGVQRLNLGMARDGENELQASRQLVELEESARLLDLEAAQWKQSVCFQIPVSHLYRFGGVGIELNEPIAQPDGQDVIGFFTDYWVVAPDPDRAWTALSDDLAAKGHACTEVRDTQQVDFPDDYEGETIWHGSRVLFSNE